METTFPTANDRFKRRFNDCFWYSVAGAALFHFGLLVLFPSMSVADPTIPADEMRALELPSDIDIPDAPEPLPRPAMPVVGTEAIDANVTITATTFEAVPPGLPKPPARPQSGTADSVVGFFVPRTVEPALLNGDEVTRALERNYPPLLRDAGIGGESTVWFYIDVNGQVLRTQLSKSSGQAALDQAALNVAGTMRFSPAVNGTQRVRVWVQIPIQFRAH